MIQTVEGALTETHSMLNRMVTLFTQAANGTYSTNNTQGNNTMGDDDTARKNIESEIKKLEEEINRIAEHTSFNGLKPLSANTDLTVGSGKDVQGLGGGKALAYENKTSGAASGVTVNDVDGKILTFQIGPSAAETIKVTAQNMTTNALFSLAASVKDAQVGTSATEGKFVLSFVKGGTRTDGKGNSKDVYYLSIAGNVKNVATANKAISVVNNAINKVSNFRAELGAAQNRLEHTINSLQVSSENITAAESRIRDTDMAEEITQYTKNNILLQAAQSMLSQANATPQGVLSMLQ